MASSRVFPCLEVVLSLFIFSTLNLESWFVKSLSSSGNCHNNLQQEHPQHNIQVWDQVLDANLCERLHNDESIPQQHRLLVRPLLHDGENKREYTALEYTLDAILTQLKDTSPYVEYWSRREWKHLEAHADIDEYLAKDFPSEDFRYPQNGHVLYLQVGTDVQGPTCVFPQLIRGGQLATYSTNAKTLEGKDEEIDNNPKHGNNGSIYDYDLVTIPAVAGRVLRFPGTALHTVPRPTNLWTIPFVRGAPKHKPTSQWGRHVVLFNTWTDQPPMNIAQSSEILTESTTDTIHKDKNCSTSSNSWVTDTWVEAKWINHHNDINTGLSKNVDNNDTNSLEQDEWGKAKIWLLGNEQRRSFIMRNVQVQAPLNTLNEALYDGKNIHIVPLLSQSSPSLMGK